MLLICHTHQNEKRQICQFEKMTKKLLRFLRNFTTEIKQKKSVKKKRKQNVKKIWRLNCNLRSTATHSKFVKC